MNSKKLERAKQLYLTDGVKELRKESDFKYRAEFIEHFDLSAENFSKMMEESMDIAKKLAGPGPNSFGTLALIAYKFPDFVKRELTNLLDENSNYSLYERIENYSKAFEDNAEIKEYLYQYGIKFSGYKKPIHHSQDGPRISTLLWLVYPNKYYGYKFNVQKEAYCYLTEDNAVNFGSSFINHRYPSIVSFLDQLGKELFKDAEFVKRLKDELADTGIDLENKKIITHFAFFVSRLSKKEEDTREMNATNLKENREIDSSNEFSVTGMLEAQNLILYGPPGTGKTYSTKRMAVEVCTGSSPESYEDVAILYKQLKDEGRIEFITFHQSYSYEEFIEGIKPVADSNGNLTYKPEDGVFKLFCDKNRNSDKPCVFIIDEINRGNIAKIFGELITLIETTKREGMVEEQSVVLPYSKVPFSIPSNITLIGTMNTADRSITQIDTALRRRFKFKEMMPDYSLLENLISKEGIEIAPMLSKMNERIEILFDREHQIGHSFFMKLNPGFDINDLNEIFKDRIIPLLKEYFYDDYAKIQTILGEFNIDEANNFIIANKVDPSLFGPNIDGDDLPDYVYKVNFDNIDVESYTKIYR